MEYKKSPAGHLHSTYESAKSGTLLPAYSLDHVKSYNLQRNLTVVVRTVGHQILENMVAVSVAVLRVFQAISANLVRIFTQHDD